MPTVALPPGLPYEDPSFVRGNLSAAALNVNAPAGALMFYLSSPDVYNECELMICIKLNDVDCDCDSCAQGRDSAIRVYETRVIIKVDSTINAPIQVPVTTQSIDNYHAVNNFLIAAQLFPIENGRYVISIEYARTLQNVLGISNQ